MAGLARLAWKLSLGRNGDEDVLVSFFMADMNRPFFILLTIIPQALAYKSPIAIQAGPSARIWIWFHFEHPHLGQYPLLMVSS